MLFLPLFGGYISAKIISNT